MVPAFSNAQWVNLFPEIKEHLINIFRRYTHVLDAELQQRACEYLALATRDDNDELLQTVCDEMPVFPERESALINRLHSRGEQAQDKRTWVIGHQSENKDRVAERFKSFRKPTASSVLSNDTPVPPPKTSLSLPANPVTERSRTSSLIADQQLTESPKATTNSMSSDIMSSLAGLDLSAPSSMDVAAGERLLPETSLNSEPDAVAAAAARPDDFQHNATLGGVNPSLLAPLTVAPNVEKWLERLSYATEGVLYEDKQVQIGINAEYRGSRGRIALFIGNKLTTPLTSVNAKIEVPTPDALDARFHENVNSSIEGGQQIQEMIHVECKNVFTEQPILRFTFLAGAFTTLVLRLPIFLNRFIEGVQLDQAAFFERWKIIGGAPREAQQIFGIQLTPSGEVDIERNAKVLSGQRMTILNGLDPNPTNVSSTIPRSTELTIKNVLAGVLHMTTAGKVGILGRVEPNKDAKLCRLTIRSTNEAVSAEMLKLLVKPLNAETAASL